jgi:hypothetical protein
MLDSVRADLHIHTIASDGTWTPQQLVEQVVATGIGLFSVTDHDTVRSVPAAAALATQKGVRFLSGVEVSAKLDGRLMHVLAYGLDPADRCLVPFLAENETRLREYDDVTVQMLLDAGYRIDLDAYRQYTWDRTRGGWKALNFFIDQGFCRDVASFFGELFAGPLTLSFPAFPPVEEVICAIQGAGAVPVWAHPGESLRDQSASQANEALARMVRAGLQGIECYSCHHGHVWTRRCLAWAQSCDLLVTGGSDSHGSFAGRQLGHPSIVLSDLRLGPLADLISS